MNKELVDFKKKLRVAVSNYMRSEGCSCCQDREAHTKNTEVLGELLGVKKYSDNSGYDFSKHQTK